MDIQKLKKRCGYDGKPQQFKYGFDLACRELVNTVEQAAKAQAVPEWISVEEALPHGNILVLAMSQTISNVFNVYNVMALDEFQESDITHWMMLPQPPKAQEQKG